MVILFFTACKKDKYTTAPQIEFKSINPNSAVSNINCNFQDIPVLTLHVTDAEGDLGFINGSDTSYVFIKNLINNKLDSAKLPDIRRAAVKNFSADIDINLCGFLAKSTRPNPKTDTLYFEVYVRDFAKNVSNTIKTTDPVYFITP
ncbi:MAG: hypothetical protein WDM90_23055 [Ferruginibacter sp.]